MGSISHGQTSQTAVSETSVYHNRKKIPSQQPQWAALVQLQIGAAAAAVVGTVKLLRNTWWRRKMITRIMAEQGIHGPPYNLVDGNYTEMKRMQEQASAEVSDHKISHDILPIAFPFQHKYSKIYGSLFLHWWGQDPIIYIAQPELIIEVLSLKFGHYEKSAQIRKAMEYLFGKGLLVATGENWVRQRHAVNSAFNMEKIKRMRELVVISVQSMIGKWTKMVEDCNGCAEIEVKQDLVDMATAVILKSCFGANNYEKVKRYPELVYELLTISSNSSPFNHFIPRFVPTKKHRKLNEIESCFQGVVQAHKEGDASDILSTLMSTNKNLTIQQVIDECKNIVFAGHETTAHMLTWTMMLLAINPDWQEKAFMEVENVCNNFNPPTFEMLPKLKTMGMIFNESLRLYPPGAQTAREALKDMKLGGKIFIPKGVSVAVNIAQVHRCKEIWGDDALEFNPSRFSEGISKACKNSVGGYLPFLLGPRVCVGQGFAIMEAKITLAIILQSFSWSLSPNYRHSPVVTLTLQPHHGLQLLFSKRQID